MSSGGRFRPRAISGVVLLALLLRLTGLGWGLPDGTHYFSYHPDEFSVAGTVSGMINTGELNPRFFHYGSATIYLTYLACRPLFGMGVIRSVVGTHVVGRLVTVVLGAGTIPLVWWLGRRLSPRSSGLLAALLLAVMPGHVLHSHFATVDVPAAFFVTLALAFAVRATVSPGLAVLALAGAGCGLAAATKYNTGIVLLAPLVVAVRRPGTAPSRAAGMVVCAAAALGAFLLATPYAVLDFAAFREDVSFELFEHAREGHQNLFEDTGNGWWYHLTANLPYVTGVPVGLLALAGAGVMARRRSPADVVLLSFALPYFLLLGFSRVRFLRYLLPLAPFLALAASEGAGFLGRRFGGASSRRRATRLAGAVALATLAILTGRQQWSFAREDPRTRAARWLVENAPPEATIGLLNIPWYYTPPVTPWNGGPDLREAFLEDQERGEGMRIVLCEGWNVESLRRAHPDYVVVSEFERREEERLGDRKALAFLAALEEGYGEVAVFDTFPRSARRIFGRVFAPHDWLYPFAQVRVYRRPGRAEP